MANGAGRHEPLRRRTRYKRPPRDRFLTDAEFTRLGRALNELEENGEVSTHAAAAIRLLMLTGCRRNEIVALRWDEVNLKRKELRLRQLPTHRWGIVRRCPNEYPLDRSSYSDY